LGVERRRRWSYDEKVRLIEETLRAGETVCGVARRHGMAQSLLFTWRRQARQGRLGGGAVPALVPVEIASTPAPAPAFGPQPSSPPAQRPRAGIIEIELGGGCRVRVDREVTFMIGKLRNWPPKSTVSLTRSTRHRSTTMVCSHFRKFCIGANTSNMTPAAGSS
jgi:transposase